MATINKYITYEYPEITMCDSNVIAYNVTIWAENETEIAQFDAHNLWRKNQRIYNGNTLETGTDSTELICKVTDKQGNVYIIPASKYEELKAPKINDNGTKNYYWRLYFDDLKFKSGRVEKHIGWRDFIQNWITEDNIYSIVLNGIANNQLSFSVTLQYNSTPTYSVSYSGESIQATKVLTTDLAECDITFTYTLPNNELYRQIGNAERILSQFYYTKSGEPGAFIDNYTIVSDVRNGGAHTITLHTQLSDTQYYYNNINSFRVYLTILAKKNDYANEWWRILYAETVGVTILPPILSPIITLPTTTQYNRGDVTLPTNIAIVDSNTTEQDKVEYNTASIVYTLTNVDDDTDVYTGVGTWSSKTSITDPEQGAMQDNTINVLFSNIGAGSYIYNVAYTYSDGNTYTAETTINVVELTLSYFGVNCSQQGYQLNKPISIYLIDTTGSSTGTKPQYARMQFVCVETGKSMERYVFLDAYYGGTYVDLRPILPNYFDVNNIEYHIKINSILYNANYEQYDIAADTMTIYVNDATHRTMRSMYNYIDCLGYSAVIIPQILEPLQGFTTQIWLPVYGHQQQIFKNNTLVYKTNDNLQLSKGWWYNIMLQFTDIEPSDVYKVLWGKVIESIKPLITCNEERVMVRFNAPDEVEMPTFAMILEGVYSEPTKKNIHSTQSRNASIDTTMYDVNEKMILMIPQLTNRSLYIYKGLFANQNLINISNGGAWVQYHLSIVSITDATADLNNGVFRIELTRNVTSKKHIVI